MSDTNTQETPQTREQLASAISSEVIIDLNQVNKWYADFHVLKDIDLIVHKGERIVVCGPSGSGKSTLIRCINHLEEHQAGSIVVDGITLDKNLKNIDHIRTEVGMVFQSFNLFPHLTILENLTLGPIWVRKSPKKDAQANAMQYLERVKIPEQADKYPGQLSGGQQQRVALARALVVSPRLLLLDEPLANLDPDLRSEMRELLLTVQRSLGITMLLVTHDQEDAIVIADQVALIRSGSLVQEGVSRDFFERPASAWVAIFFGAGNLIPGERTNNEVVTPLGRLRVMSESPALGPVLVTIRPEAVVLDAAEGQANTFEGKVIAAEFRGSHIRMQLTAGSIDLEANVPIDDAKSHAVGSTVRVTLPPEKLWPLPAD